MANQPSVRINTDLQSLKAAVERLKQDPSQLQQFERDPGGFLSRLGIELDSGTVESIRSQLGARKTAVTAGALQAGSIHVDIL